LTIAAAPCVRANSTINVSNAVTRIRSRCSVAALMNATRSSRGNSVAVLAQRVVDDRDDHLVEELRRAGDDVDVAVRDRVVGPRTDGDAGRSLIAGASSYTRISVSP